MRESRRNHWLSLPLVALMTTGSIGCAPGDSRILAIFRQGSTGYAYSSKIGDAYYYFNPPTLVGGYVYIGTSRKHSDRPGPQNWFFKLDANLVKVWEFPLGESEVRGPAALDTAGNVYFVAQSGRAWEVGGWTDYSVARSFLYSLTNDGAYRWRLEITPPNGLDDGMGMFSPAIAADGTIYIGGGKLHALDSSGAVKWEWVPSWPIVIANAPIIDPAGNLFFTASQCVYSLRPDGIQRWASCTWEGVSSGGSPAFSVGYDRIYAPIWRNLYCIDAATGAPEFGPG